MLHIVRMFGSGGQCRGQLRRRVRWKFMLFYSWYVAWDLISKFIFISDSVFVATSGGTPLENWIRTAHTSRILAFLQSTAKLMHWHTQSRSALTVSSKLYRTRIFKENFSIFPCFLEVCSVRLDFESFQIYGLADTNEMTGGACTNDKLTMTV